MGFVVVVKRDEPDLFKYLKEHFQEAEVLVMLDRRHAERRRGETPAGDHRRRRDRRAFQPDDDPLWRYGFRVAVARAV
jgi:hypothetical protein